MAYEAVGILCRRCLDMRVPEGELIAFLDKYVSELPEDERTDEENYRARLTKCAECAERYEATCRLCGCYVQARAAKKRMSCPIPGHPKWLPIDSKDGTSADNS